ncbi:MAG: DUF1015 domain-containing protein [Actinomycetota bacterium]|nr:DUF1015 domain-containing protein [Actinomycetota bacterium]
MPSLKPFHGVRYSSSFKAAAVTCPPYDIISPADQLALYDRDAHNAVRLELPAGDATARYESAAATFEKWQAEGALVADEQPALYVYRQDFVHDGMPRRVTGVIGALRLEPFGETSGVLPHERTMEGPKADRLALMEALPVNVSPIYAIYRGGGGVTEFLDALEQRPTAMRFEDGERILHRLWVITAPAEVDLLAGDVAAHPLVIADGHHRYETALLYARAHDTPEAGSIMCYCVDADAAQLIVLPYHRMLKGAAVGDALATSDPLAPEADPQEVLESSKADHPFVFATRRGRYLVEVSDDEVVNAVGDRDASWRKLDVVALHEALLPRLVPDAEVVGFSKDARAVETAVSTGEIDCGVLLRSLQASDVVDVARSGERMPQKASYFWPKAVTGLVFHPLK